MAVGAAGAGTGDRVEEHGEQGRQEAARLVWENALPGLRIVGRVRGDAARKLWRFRGKRAAGHSLKLTETDGARRGTWQRVEKYRRTEVKTEQPYVRLLMFHVLYPPFSIFFWFIQTHTAGKTNSLLLLL